MATKKTHEADGVDTAAAVATVTTDVVDDQSGGAATAGGSLDAGGRVPRPPTRDKPYLKELRRLDSPHARAGEIPVVHPAVRSALSAAGEVVIFDRSWYNRAGVERVIAGQDRAASPGALDPDAVLSPPRPHGRGPSVAGEVRLSTSMRLVPRDEGGCRRPDRPHPAARSSS